MAQRRRRTSAKKLTRTALAKDLGVAHSTVGRWVDRGCPRNKDGTFDRDAVVAWRAAQRPVPEKDPTAKDSVDPNRSARGASTPSQREILKWQTKYRKHRAIGEELKVRKLQGELVEFADVLAFAASRAALFRRVLLELPMRMGHELHGLERPKIVDRLTRECHRILRQLVDENPTADEDEEDGEAA